MRHDIARVLRVAGSAASLSLLVLLVFAFACAPPKLLRIPDPVGPPPGETDRSGLETGELVVYTDSTTVEQEESIFKKVYLPYRVLDLRGDPVVEVERTPADQERPAVVPLAPGSYLVHAPGLFGRQVEVVARIESGLRTTVYLDGSWKPKDGAPQAALARAPDGAPIGWHGRASSRLGFEGALRYEGSSTIATFIRDASTAYKAARLSIDARGESEAGEVAVLGTADIGGVARHVEAPPEGVECTVIGYDALVVVVHAASPVTGLTMEQVAAIFAGEITDWSEVGGDAGPIVVLVANPDSATHAVFADRVMGSREYAGVEVEHDLDLVGRVANSTGMIGHITMALAQEDPDVRALPIDGQQPSANNPSYPIVRPLNLCVRDTAPRRTRDFLQWVLGDEGQRVLRRRFVSVERGPAP